uniref:Protein Shroom2 n=1 Tax=Angiostrongylus cantonensis TaxID=6313 RepID=A0A0K0DRP9_ANGCA
MPQKIAFSVSQQFPASTIPPQTSLHSEVFDAPSNVVDVPTPEEVRSLLRSFLETKATSQYRSAVGFPREPTTSSSLSGCRDVLPPQEDIAFNLPLSSSVLMSSRPSSKRHSYISLYDYGGGSSAGDDSYSTPTLFTSQRLRNSQEMRADVHRLPTTREIEEEEERRKQSTVSTKTLSSKTSLRKTGSGNRFETKDIHSEFQPWPSIADVQRKKEQLLKSTPLPFYQSHLQKTDANPEQSQPGPSGKPPNVHQHRKYAQEASPVVSSTDDERRSVSPSRRFRISVSPTRKAVVDSTVTG